MTTDGLRNVHFMTAYESGLVEFCSKPADTPMPLKYFLTWWHGLNRDEQDEILAGYNKTL